MVQCPRILCRAFAPRSWDIYPGLAFLGRYRFLGVDFRREVEPPPIADMQALHLESSVRDLESDDIPTSSISDISPYCRLAYRDHAASHGAPMQRKEHWARRR
ncbi:hypothetical protein BC2230_170007 [Burkholderia cepacia]